MKKRIGSLLLAFALLLSIMPAALAEAAPGELTATAETQNIQKYGNVTLSLTCEEIKAAGYAYGDVVTVEFLDQTLELPLCSNFSDVDSGTPALFARAQDQYVLAAINMGDFATTYGIAIKTTNEDKSVKWDYADGVTGPVTFRISLKEAGGYLDEYVMHQLSFTNAREDYRDLTDEQFANFRTVRTTGMGCGTLYRTSSPVNPENGHSAYADAALRSAGVTVVMNLADDEETVKSYEGYDASCYATAKHIALNMGVDFTAEDFRVKLAEGLRFFAANPGVYAVHCKEGKDRAGFVCALLEAFMGARCDEIVGDYMTTFYNYYGVTPADERYERIAEGNIVKTLSRAFGVSDLKNADLKACAERYFRDIGLNEQELSALRSNLAAEHARDTSFFTPQKHTELNYDEIEYERIDPAPLLAEIDALRALCADAKNEAEFERRFLALASELERMGAMLLILQIRIYADSKDAWAVSEFQTAEADEMTVRDAFTSLIRDALSSPCARALTSRMPQSVAEKYRGYRDMTDEEKTLRARETALVNEYQSKIIEPVSVTANGVSYTNESAKKALAAGKLTHDEWLEIHRSIAKEANAKVGEIFVELVGVRSRIAKLRGYDTFADYAYKEIFYRDYTPEDARTYCDAVKRYLIPTIKAYSLLEQHVDEEELPEGVAYSGEGMFHTLFPYFAALSDELLESARYTYEHRAFDVDPAPNKTGTAYSVGIPYYDMPFYFNNARGTIDDLLNSIHELGHNNDAYWNGGEDDWNKAGLAYDTAEVHSQGLEVLMLRFYPELFGSQADAARFRRLDAYILDAVVVGCLYDEWLRRVYETPELTLQKANRLFREVCEEYGRVSADDPREEMYSWYDVPHNFTSPMYYISYSTSAVGALEFWKASQENYFAAVDDYLRFTSQSGKLGFVEAFEAVGMDDPMSEPYLKELAQTIHDQLLPVKPYTDVYADDWYARSVIYVDYYALMNGVGGNLFAPNANATREQSMTLLARAADHGEHDLTLDEGVAWAVESGVSDGEERGATLTREQFVTMLYRMMALRGHDVSTGEDASLSDYSDGAAVSDWALPAMRWAVSVGVVEGMDDGSLAPQSDVTRAQMAEMLMRCITTPANA